MATKARSGSTRTPRAAVKTKRTPVKTKKSPNRKSAATSKKAVGSALHRHLITAMILLAVMIVGLIAYVTATSSYASSTARATATGTIKGIAGKCLDNQSAKVANGNKIQTYTCNNSVAQKWSVYSDDSLRVQGYCLDVAGRSTAVGARVQLYQCNGTPAQKWSINKDGTVINPNSGHCLDVRYGNTADGGVVWMYTCNGTAAQKWATPAVTPSSGSGSGSTTSPSAPVTSTPPPSTLSPHTGGSGGSRTDQTFQTYTANGYTSRYHLYAGGLDWSKPVGALIYTDGSAEYGLKNPNSSYLLAGANGMIGVAKKHNMVLITPFAPNQACADGDGSCWYMGDSPGYTKWAESLVQTIYSKYPIHKNRVAFGGYSSGAQLATEFWTPSGAAQRTMTDGVIVAISYGGSPKMSQVAYSSSFKSSVHMNWNTGSKDFAYTTTSGYGVKAGYNAYTSAGFKTSLDVISGLGHGRSGQFGAIMDAQIKQHVAPSQGTVSATPNPITKPATTSATPVPQPEPVSSASKGLISHTVTPMKYGAKLTAKVDPAVEKVLFRVSKSSINGQTGFYKYGYPDAKGNITLTLKSSLSRNTQYYYVVELDDVRVTSGSANSGTFKTLKGWW